MAMAQAITGNIELFYQNTETQKEDGTKESTDTMTQGYFFGFRNAISQQMNYLFDFRATKNETDDQKSTSLLHTGQFNVLNNIFFGNLGYQLMDRDQSNTSRVSSNSWNFALNSNIENIPKIRFQFTQDRNYDHRDIHQIDNTSKQISSGLQYGYNFFNIMLNYNKAENNDFVQDTVQNNDSYYGKADFHESFFGNKLSINSDFTGSRDSSSIRFNNDISFLESRNRQHGLYLYDTTPLYDEMNDMISLIDNDYTTGTTIDIGSTGGTYHNIGVDLEEPRDCEMFYLYTSQNYDPAVSNSHFIWEVYYSDDGITWNLITSNANFDYNILYYRFEISFPSRSARYFKLVNTSYDNRSFVGSVYITEVEILGNENRVRGEVNKTLGKRLGTNFMAIYRPIVKLTLGYNFSYDLSENESDSTDNTTKKTELSHGTNINYIFHKYFSSSAQYWYRTSIADKLKNKNQNLSLQLNSSPLESITTSLSLNHNESKEENSLIENEKITTKSVSNSSLLYIMANILEGIDISSNYYVNKSKSSNGSESTGHAINLDLRTELTKNITFESGYNHSWQKTENSEPVNGWTDTSGLDFKLRYSPSDKLFLSSDYSYNKNEQGSDSTYGFNWSWLMTEKIQLNFSSKYKQNWYDRNTDETISTSLDAGWNISRSITFKCGHNFSKSRGNRNNENQTFYARLSARL